MPIMELYNEIDEGGAISIAGEFMMMSFGV